MTVTDGGRRETGSEPPPPRLFRRVHNRLHANPFTGLATKVVITCIGVLVLCAGIVMMVTPGPGLVGIAIGLGILATEWDWAERWVRAVRDRARAAAETAREMDPVVRRRRIILAAVAFVALVAVVVGYLVAFGWPGFAVDGWNWVQDTTTTAPELPGM